MALHASCTTLKHSRTCWSVSSGPFASFEAWRFLSVRHLSRWKPNDCELSSIGKYLHWTVLCRVFHSRYLMFSSILKLSSKMLSALTLSNTCSRSKLSVAFEISQNPTAAKDMRSIPQSRIWLHLSINNCHPTFPLPRVHINTLFLEILVQMIGEGGCQRRSWLVLCCTGAAQQTVSGRAEEWKQETCTAVCECSGSVTLRRSGGGMVIAADALGVEVVAVVLGREAGGFQALSQASCLGTPCTAHFLPGCLLKNAQLHSPSAKNLCSVNPDRDWDGQPGRTTHSFSPLTFPAIQDSSRWLERKATAYNNLDCSDQGTHFGRSKIIWQLWEQDDTA